MRATHRLATSIWINCFLSSFNRRLFVYRLKWAVVVGCIRGNCDYLSFNGNFLAARKIYLANRCASARFMLAEWKKKFLLRKFNFLHGREISCSVRSIFHLKTVFNPYGTLYLWCTIEIHTICDSAMYRALSTAHTNRYNIRYMIYRVMETIVDCAVHTRNGVQIVLLIAIQFRITNSVDSNSTPRIWCAVRIGGKTENTVFIYFIHRLEVWRWWVEPSTHSLFVTCTPKHALAIGYTITP